MAVKKDETVAEPAPDLGSPDAPSSASGRIPGGEEPSDDTVGGRPSSRGMPVWVVPAYSIGLIVLYVGERVVEATPTAHWVLSGAGVLAVVVATVARFNPNWRVGGDRKQIENVLAALSVTGVVALVCYALTTDWGGERIGVAGWQKDTRENVEAVLTVAWVSLITLSIVPLLFAEAALLPMRYSERPESRRIRAAAASGLTIAMAAVYCSLFVFVASGIDWKADYSYFKTSQPSESTRHIAAALKEPVKITAFFPQVNDVRVEVERYLRDLTRGQPNIELTVQDRLLVPKLARKLRATQDGVIVLTKGEVNKRLTIGADMKAARPKLKTLDRDFQEQLLKIVRSRRTAYLTIGHGEINDRPRGGRPSPDRDATILRKLLQKQNYVVKNLGITQGLGRDVPDDANVVCVLGPSEPFSPSEVDSLRRYAEGGGKLYLALDPDSPQTTEAVVASPLGKRGSDRETAPVSSGRAGPMPAAVASAAPHPAGSGVTSPSRAPSETSEPASPFVSGLDALAGIVGLSYRGSILANERQHLRRRFNDSDRTLIFSNRFSSHASVSTLSRNSARAALVVSGAGSLDKRKGATQKVDFTVRSMSGTFGDTNKNYTFDKDTEKKRQYNLAAAVSRPSPERKKATKKGKKEEKGPAPPDEMRAFVVADADALSDVVMANVIANQVFFVDAIRWLGGEESFAGEVNTEEDVRIEHTKQKDLVWFYATIFGAPALVLGAGIWVSRRSRSRRRRKKKK